MIKVVYPGTFDPITRGHEDVVRRAAGLFGEVIVAVAESREKTLFTLDERVEMSRVIFAGFAMCAGVGSNAVRITVVAGR